MFVAFSLGMSAQTETTSQDFDFEITGETTRTELYQLRQDFGELGFDFQYQPSFDQELRLTTIIVKVIEMEGEFKSGYESTQLQAGDTIKLRRETDAEGNVSYCVGRCE